MDTIIKQVSIGLLLLFVGIGTLKAQNIALHGFVQANYAVRTASTGQALTPKGHSLPEYILGDERIQIKFDESKGKTKFFGRMDFYYDAIDKKMGLDLREAYIDVALGKFDIRTGRQIITWGLGDLVFISDVFPKDWVAFLSGRPLQYLKVGSDAININFFPKAASFQLIVTPFYQADVLPTGERLQAFDPFPTIAFRKEIQPELSIKNTQISGRIYRYIGNFDVSLYFHKGFWGSPPGLLLDQQTQNSLSIVHPKLNLYSVSMQGSLLSGILSVEGGYLDSRDDTDGTNPGIENSQARLMMGYNRPFGSDLSINIQYYGEQIQNYAEMVQSLGTSANIRKELRHTLSFRLTQYVNYQTLKFSIFTSYSFNEQDYFIKPEIKYDLGSDIYVTIGYSLFGGKQSHTFYGQFDKNDGISLTLRYGF